MIFKTRSNTTATQEKNQQNGNVVIMDRFRKACTLSPLRQVEAYWTALRDGGGIPKRSQIDPRGIENILEYTFIIERIAPGIARFRVAGQHLNALTGMDVRGMPLTSFFTPAARKTLSPLCEQMFDTPAVITLELQSRKSAGHPPAAAHMILLPLRSDLGEVSRALGVVVGEQGSGPDTPRFDIAKVEAKDLSDTRQSDPMSNVDRGPEQTTGPDDLDRDADLIPPAVSTGFADGQRTYSPAPPYLRLVVSREDA